MTPLHEYMAGKMSDEELAARVKVSRSYITQIRLGLRQNPSLAICLKIFDETGVRVGVLKGKAKREIPFLRRLAAEGAAA